MSSKDNIKVEEDEELLTSDSSDSSSSESSVEKPKQKIKTKMSEKVALSVLTKFIKPYNGDRESLPAFLTNCENAFSLASTDQQNVLCKYIVSQLEGKAQLACSIKNFTSWLEIKQYLKSTFGEKKHSTHLLVDLQNCKQLPSEDVTQYSMRIESCLTRIQSDIHYSCADPKELLGRLSAMEDLALNTFILGMNSNFSHIVRCRNPTTLSDAITHAIEEEKLYKLTKLPQRPSKQCSICQKAGHLASDCYRNKSRVTPNFHHVNSNSHSSNNNQQNKSFPKFNSNKMCAYCKKQGHLINECRKLMYKNNLQGNSASNANPSSSHMSGQGNIPHNNRSNVHVVNTDDNELMNLN